MGLLNFVTGIACIYQDYLCLIPSNAVHLLIYAFSLDSPKFVYICLLLNSILWILL